MRCPEPGHQETCSRTRLEDKTNHHDFVLELHHFRHTEHVANKQHVTKMILEAYMDI